MHFRQIPTLLRLGLFARRRRQCTQEPGEEQFTAALKALREATAEKPLATRILVAEDNSVNRKVAQGLLNLLGCQVDFAENGRAAVELACTGTFGLILMDCQMPEMDGFAATRAIRKWQEGRRRTPIIALSASASPADRAECLAAGMDDCLAKPIEKQKLQEALTRWLPVNAVGRPTSAPAPPVRLFH